MNKQTNVDEIGQRIKAESVEANRKTIVDEITILYNGRY